MWKTIATITTATAISLAVTGAASADSVRNAQVQDIFTEMHTSEPYTQRECVTVRRDSNNAASSALGGMIIGGIIGKGVTGRDNGAAAGAVIGGLIGADQGARNSHSRYEEECTNVTRYRNSVQTVYDYSVMTFTYEGKEYTLTFIK